MAQKDAFPDQFGLPTAPASVPVSRIAFGVTQCEPPALPGKKPVPPHELNAMALGWSFSSSALTIGCIGPSIPPAERKVPAHDKTQSEKLRK